VVWATPLPSPLLCNFSDLNILTVYNYPPPSPCIYTYVQWYTFPGSSNLIFSSWALSSHFLKLSYPLSFHFPYFSFLIYFFSSLILLLLSYVHICILLPIFLAASYSLLFLCHRFSQLFLSRDFLLFLCLLMLLSTVHAHRLHFLSSSKFSLIHPASSSNLFYHFLSVFLPFSTSSYLVIPSVSFFFLISNLYFLNFPFLLAHSPPLYILEDA
jgi:hypothetical protein